MLESCWKALEVVGNDFSNPTTSNKQKQYNAVNQLFTLLEMYLQKT